MQNEKKLTHSEIGKRIKEKRVERNCTIKELSERIELCGGGYVSEAMISMWENGKRRIYADQLYYVCLALSVPPMTLFGEDTPNEVDDRLAEEIPLLDAPDKDIFYHMFNRWDGNARALVRFVGLYMALPRKLRMDIAGMGITMYRIGEESGQLDKSAPPVDIEYLDDIWGKLMK